MDDERASRIGRFLIDRLALVAFVVFLQFVSIGVVAWGITESHRNSNKHLEELERVSKENWQGVTCLVEQLAEHRHLNATAHRANAEAHTHTYPVPADDEPPSVPKALEQACEPVYARKK